MRVNVRGNDQVKLSDGAREYITQRVSTLEKLFNQSENVVANVLCKGKEKSVVAEITIPLKHIILRSEVEADTLYGAVNLAIDKVEKQLLKHKNKVSSYIKRRDGISEYFSELQTEKQSEPVVTKVKEIDAEVMSLDEAIIKMEISDHDFFAFINEKNHRHTVVYVRKDGGYGVLETKE